MSREVMEGLLKAVCQALEDAGHTDVRAVWGSAGPVSYSVEVHASGEKVTYIVDPSVPTFVRVVDMPAGFGF